MNYEQKETKREKESQRILWAFKYALIKKWDFLENMSNMAWTCGAAELLLYGSDFEKKVIQKIIGESDDEEIYAFEDPDDNIPYLIINNDYTAWTPSDQEVIKAYLKCQ